MTQTELLVGCGVALALVALLVVLHFLNTKCPRCRSRRTVRCALVPAKWSCDRCFNLFPRTFAD